MPHRLKIRERAVRKHRARVEHDNLAQQFEREVAARRQAVVRRPYGFGWIDIRVPDRFSMDECEKWHAYGFQVPLDLVPHDYWIDENTGLPRFGEEMLGDNF